MEKLKYMPLSVSKKSHRKNAEKKGRFFAGIEYLVRDREQRTKNSIFSQRRKKSFKGLSSKSILAGCRALFYVALTFLVLRIRLQKHSPQAETTSVRCFSFLTFPMKGVLNTYIHSADGRAGMGFTVGMVSPLL